ncbi:STAS-like domain-containing protein [Chitinibacter fontanus]|uniref:STAS-like domain-containing protein n=1 Tax=Chitinibacter fontanus TaxID=1737446 RepID=A0A7D5Z2B5_9NEIS|nr:STAS-like domain-containing protein [Chitinibacter fontanus]QLI80243.1 STAS-like domain-containing protein [Chitinibacter fontanus]
MVTVVVKEIAKQAYTYEDGAAVSDLIASAFEAGDTVNLSFKGIDGIPSSFANGCFVRLFEIYGLEKIKSNLIISDSTKQINLMIKSRLVFESEHRKTT